MTNILLVMAGGAAGSALRYLFGRMAGHMFGLGFPWGTLGVNIIGGFLMGLLAAMLARFGTGGEQMRLLVGVGALGGFTTFSSFSLETMLMIERGQATMALGYALASVIGAVGALWLGLLVVRSAA